MKYIKRKLLNLLYRVLVVLTEHKYDKIDEGLINNWLATSYQDKGFKDYLTNEYTKYSRYLTSAYRPNYQSIVDMMIVLRSLEKRAKEAYENREDN